MDNANDDRGRSVAVLICDDNASIRAWLREVVELRSSLSVIGEAANGNEAVVEATRLQPDVILLDIAMPHRTGLDALPEIRQVAPEAKIIVFSSFLAAEVSARALALGAVRFLTKGATPNTINAAIEDAAAAPVPALPAAGSAAEVDQIGEQASDRDRTAESRDRAAELRDSDAEDRDVLAREHEQMRRDRDQTLSDQDQAASGRDQRNADKDQHAADDDFAAGGDQISHDRGVHARGVSGRERAAVSVLREEVATARLQPSREESSDEGTLLQARLDREGAADDREEAAGDREAAAGDREEAASERAEARRDRTESALAAERALETLETMSDAFFTLDSEWRFTYLNPKSEAILERRREDLIGKSMWDEFPERVGSRFDDEYRRAVRDQVPVRFEERYEPLGRTLEIRVYPVTDGLAIYFSDVTAERLHDERLRRGQRLEAIGRVTAGVAHDFNNLLAAMLGFAGLGQVVATDEKTKRYFDQIDSAGQKAVELTRQLLAFAREQDLVPTVTDLNEVVGSLTTLLGQLVPASVDLRFVLSPQPVPVFADRSQLERVITNLVVNSRDAVETTGSITVSTTPDSPVGIEHDVHGPSGWLQVTDTGCGIPAELLPHIFDPFFTTKPPGTGTGLGLATIYGIVSQSSGTILVDSTLSTGTTMTVALPAGQPIGPPRQSTR